MIPEFCKFGRVARQIRQLVDHNIGVKTLYKKLHVLFLPDFVQAFHQAEKLAQTHHAVVATHLVMVNKDTHKTQSHAVSIWMDYKNKTNFLFDPNGRSLPDDLYEIQGWKTLDNLSKVFSIRVPKVLGPQRGLPDTPGYIHHGGYCEFINYMMIEQYYAPTSPSIVRQISNPQNWKIDVCMGEYVKNLVSPFGTLR